MIQIRIGVKMNYKHILTFLLIFFLVAGCNSMNKKESSVVKEKFGQVGENEIDIYTLTNDKGAQAKIMNFGARVVSLTMPDRQGNFDDIVTGYDSLKGYVNDNSYFGAIVGRYGNRIGKGKFSLDGKEYQLTINDGMNHLHGGKIGFFKAVWNAEPITSEAGPALKLSLVSPDGDEGYPGNG